MSKFYKRREVYSPDDLCWIEVIHYMGKVKADNTVTIRTTQRSTEEGVVICRGEGKHLDEMIAILQHLRGRFP